MKPPLDRIKPKEARYVGRWWHVCGGLPLAMFVNIGEQHADRFYHDEAGDGDPSARLAIGEPDA